MNWYGGREPHHIAELRRLFTTFGYLVANQGAVAVIGLAYWVVATHLFGPTEVGLSAAAASTALLLAAVGALGIPLLLLAEVESVDATERRVFFTTGNAIAAFVVLILAIGTVVLSPWLGQSLRIIGADPVAAALFVVGSVATMAGLTLDGAAVGLHRGAVQLWRGSLSSVLKLVCVVVLVLAFHAHQHWSDLCLGDVVRGRILRLHADAQAGTQSHRRRNAGSPSSARTPVWQTLAPAPRAQSLYKFGLLHRPTDGNPPDLTVGRRLLFRCVLARLRHDGHPILARPLSVRRALG